jgi:uncharacterized protein (TIGR03067 family)
MAIKMFSVLTAGLLSIASARCEEKMESDNEKLAGVWTCTSAINDGKPLAEEIIRELRLTLTKDGGYKTERGKQVLFDSTYKLDSREKPKQIDMIGTEGEARGKTAPGIYALDGDTLKICYTMPGGKRPKEFESKPGSKATMAMWKRANKQ